MALHLVVHIVLVRAEEKKGPKIDVTFGWEGRGECVGLLRNRLLSGNGVQYVNSTVFRLSYHILNLCNHVLGFSSEMIHY